MNRNATIAFLIVAVVAVTIWSGIGPADQLTWFLEAVPVIAGLPLLVYLARHMPFTTLLYILLAIHAVILLVGSHYTYAEVPAGFWVSDWLGLERNHYDRLGHLAQGFVPALLAREVLINRTPLRPGRWLFFLSMSVALAFSAFYELIEWWTALISGEAAESFLGTQGDVWDTQWDMCLALIGAISGQLIFSRVQDRQMAGLD